MESSDDALPPAGGKRMKGPHDLTKGPIGRSLLMFAVPTLFSNVLQSANASINTVWIGRFLGENALAATANTTNIIFLCFSALFGFGMAATILIGQSMGRRDVDAARRAVGSAAGLFLGTSIVVAILGISMTDKLLYLMATPKEASHLASAYLKVMLLGMPFMAVNTLLMMSVRGVGDAMTPLWAMILGIVVDAGLNPFLIAGIGPFPQMGIVGSATATLASSFTSMVVMLSVVYWRDLPIRLRGHELAYLIPDPKLLKVIVTKGFAMGLQMLVMTLGGLLMIGLVNHAGVDTAAAYGVALQLWNYVQMPALAMGAAVSAMAAQNIGAGRWDRVRMITRRGLLFNFIMTAVMVETITILDKPALGLFLGAGSPSISVAERIQLIAGWSFLISGSTLVLFGTVRANGAVTVPLIIMFLGLLVFRVAFARLGQFWLGFDALWWAFPASSLVTVTMAWTYYLKGNWRRGALVDKVEQSEPIATASPA